MVGFVELIINQGTSFNSIITIADDATGAGLNLLGYSVTSNAKRSYYSIVPSANFVCTIVDSANGNLSLSLSSSNTANMKAGKHVFDVKITSPAAVTDRVVEGFITVTPQVST